MRHPDIEDILLSDLIYEELSLLSHTQPLFELHASSTVGAYTKTFVRTVPNLTFACAVGGVKVPLP